MRFSVNPASLAVCCVCIVEMTFILLDSIYPLPREIRSLANWGIDNFSMLFPNPFFFLAFLAAAKANFIFNMWADLGFYVGILLPLSYGVGVELCALAQRFGRWWAVGAYVALSVGSTELFYLVRKLFFLRTF